MHLWNNIQQRVFTGLFILVFLPGLGFSQQPGTLVSEFIEKYIDYIIDPHLTTKMLQSDGMEILKELDPYLSDTLVRTRTGAYWVAAKVGTTSDDNQVRLEAVKMLVGGLNDSDAGIVGYVISSMNGFQPSDFNAEQRYTIAIKIKAVPLTPHLDKLILLSGYIGIDELIYNYKNMLADEKLYGKKEKWNMKLAMARMGDAQAISEVVGRVSALRVNDDVIYDIYPGLAYTRQKQAFDILLHVIMSDEKNCLSSNPDNEAEIICAFRVLGYTAQYIQGFPLEINNYGEPVIENYDQALETVRKWITENKENYQLVGDVY